MRVGEFREETEEQKQKVSKGNERDMAKIEQNHLNKELPGRTIS